MPRVLIVDDHVILRRGLRGILQSHPGWDCCGEAESGEAAIAAASDVRPDVVIMDVSMPGIGGIRATEILHEKFPLLKIVLLTLHKSTELIRAGFSAGATGYVLKSDEEDQLIAALEAVSRDTVYVTTSLSPETISRVLREILPSAVASGEIPIAAKAAVSKF